MYCRCSQIELSVTAFIKASAAIGYEQTAKEQSSHMLSIEEELVSPRASQNLVQIEYLREFMFNIFSQRGEPDIDNALLIVGTLIRSHNSGQRRKNRISVECRVDK